MTEPISQNQKRNDNAFSWFVLRFNSWPTFVRFTIILDVIVGFIFIAWWAIGTLPIRMYPEHIPGNKLNAGTYGDSFGFVNSLFSCLAFIAAMGAVVMQTMQNQRTIELTSHMRDDDRRRTERDALLKVKHDMAHLFHSLIVVSAALMRRKTPPMDLELPELDDLDEASFIFDANIIFIKMTFAEKGVSLGDSILTLLRVVRTWRVNLSPVDMPDLTRLTEAMSEVDNRIEGTWDACRLGT